MTTHEKPDGTYVLQQENFVGEVNAMILGQSPKDSHIFLFTTYVAAHQLLGREWNPKIDGNIFYNNNINKAEPKTQYLRWFLPEEIKAFNETHSYGCELLQGILQISALNDLSNGRRKIQRRYRIQYTPYTVFDLMAAEGATDQAFANSGPLALPPPSQLPASATAAIASHLPELDSNLAEYLPKSYKMPQQLLLEAATTPIVKITE